MSRNFELLHQSARLQEMLETPAHSAELPQTMPAAAADAVADNVPCTPALDVGGPVREELAKLVVNLFMVPGAKGPRQVVFAGTESGVGCSWMCAHAGEVLASQTNKSVCVVDCNLRTPGLHQQFAIDNHFGLADALLQSNPAYHYVRQLSRKNLWLLSCGSTTENWSDKVASEGLRLRLEELRAQFDYVLMDVASINTCSDGLILGGLSDGVVLILKANSTRRETAQKALQQLKAANIPVLGAVLNQRTFPIPDRIYDWL